MSPLLSLLRSLVHVRLPEVLRPAPSPPGARRLRPVPPDSKRSKTARCRRRWPCPADAVSWWTANNTAADAMGLNNATLSSVTYATGEVGKAFSFNGANGWAALGDPSSLAFTASFTIEGWIKVNGLPTNYNFGSIMFRGDDRGGLDPY